MNLSFDVPTALLRDQRGKVTVRELFFGDIYSTDAYVHFPASDFVATDLILLSSDTQKATYAIRGKYSSDGMKVIIGFQEFETKFADSTLLTFSVDPINFKGVKILIAKKAGEIDIYHASRCGNSSRST